MMKSLFLLSLYIFWCLNLQDPRYWMLNANLLLGITQRIPWNLIDITDSIQPFPSHKCLSLYIDRMPAVLVFLVPNGCWLWYIKVIIMFLKTAVWKKSKQRTMFRCLMLLPLLLPLFLSSASETAYFFWYNKHSGEMRKMKNPIITALIFKCTRTAILCSTAFAFMWTFPAAF